MATALVGASAAASGLFNYNRQNFMFDKEQQLKREYQGQKMHIKQYELYREDVHDLVELTVAKMDNYLIINTLQLMFCVILFTEGKPKPGKWPQRLHWLFFLCNVGAFLYFLLAVWLAMHASIAAHSFGVRMLTQFVRLPIPNKDQLDAARAKATDYEASKAKDLFRIPVLKQQMKRLNKTMEGVDDIDAASDGDGASDTGSNSGNDPEDNLHTPVAMLKHVQLFRQLQGNWQSYDAYSRVCMTMGMNQFLHALGYYSVGMLISENSVPLPAFSCVIMFNISAWLIMRLDLYLTRRILAIAAFLILCPPVLTLAALTADLSSTDAPVISDLGSNKNFDFLLPLIFVMHMAWILFILGIAKADFVNGVALPTQFRAVTYLDVFGWLSADTPATTPADMGITAADNAGDREMPLAEGPSLLPPVDEETSFAELEADTVAMTLASTASPPLEGDAFVAASRFEGARPGYVFKLDTMGLGYYQDARQRHTRRRQIALIRRCKKEQAELETMLQLWEQEQTGTMLGGRTPGNGATSGSMTPRAAGMRRTIDGLRATFEGSQIELQDVEENFGDVEDDALGRQLTPATPTPPAGQTWVQINWEDVFYYCPETGDHVFERPQPPARVHDIGMLEDQVNAFQSKVHALTMPSGGVGSMTPSSRRIMPPSSRSFSQARSLPAQGAFAVMSPLAAASFYPQEGGGGERTSRRPPGQMPWRSFLQGSLVLVLMWTIGTIWTFLHLCGVDIPIRPAKPEGLSFYFEDFETLDLRLAFNGDWPHAFFSPRGLACHPAMGSSLFITEKFAVHELRVGAHATGKLEQATVSQSALSRCLASSRDFKAGGIQSISLDCTDSGRCSALLFGASGQGALQCALPGTAADGDESIESKAVAVHGGKKWKGLITGRNQSTFWAIGEDSLVQMRPRHGLHGDTAKNQELVPQHEIQHEAAKNVALIHALSGLSEGGTDKVLTLDHEGLLRAWSTQHSSEPLTWRVPNKRSVDTWTGMCAVGDSLYVAGVSHSGKPPSIWRARLPASLQDGSAVR